MKIGKEEKWKRGEEEKGKTGKVEKRKRERGKWKSGNDRTRNRREKFEPKTPRVEADPKKQLEVSISFLEGLIKSFGLEGAVEGETEDRNLLVKVTGEQTEALVGEKGRIFWYLDYE